MARQLERRDSSGWAELSWGVVLLEVALWVEGLSERLVRRVSCTPGAEGAEGLRAAFWEAWVVAGTMRRDWSGC